MKGFISISQMLSFLLFLLLVCLPCGVTAAPGERLVISTNSENCLKLDGDHDKLNWEDDGTIVWEAPHGDRVLFSFPLPKGEKFEDYGLGKFDLKIDGGIVDVMVFIERPGERRRLYRPIDITDQRDGWQTIHLELSRPEIIRESFFEAEQPRWTFNFWSVRTGYPDEKQTRRISVRNVRVVKRYMDVKWNGTDYTSKTDSSGNLVFEYPITIVNRDTKRRTVKAAIEHLEGTLADGVIAPTSKAIAAGDSASFTATLTLPAESLDMLSVLYCEWFLPKFSIEGVPDSEETILRSSDHITLPIIIMPENIGNPIILFDSDGLEAMRERWRSTEWGKKEGDGWISRAENAIKGDLTIPDGPGWAAAYYYCTEHRSPLRYEGPGKHKCRVGGEYHDKDFNGVDHDRNYRTNLHSAKFTAARYLALAYSLTGDSRFSDGALNILHQYKEKYFTWDWLDLDASDETIDKGRVQFAKYMESMYLLNLTEAYDILKGTGAVSGDEASDLEQNFTIPISVEMTDYRLGAIHRQQVITKNALATGLTCEHAPLLAFATSGPVSVLKLRRIAASAEGIAHGHGYANVTRRQFHMAGMLERIGVDTYDHMLKRLLWGSIWWNVPFYPGKHSYDFLLASHHYPDPEFRKYARKNLIEGEAPPLIGTDIELSKPPSVNFPNSGLTILRRPWGDGTIDAEFKWGLTDNRGSFSVLSLGLYFGGYRCQSYPGHFPWGSTDLHHQWQIQSASHSTIIVDRKNQSNMQDYVKDHYMPHASKQIFYEDGEHAASSVAYNDRMYPGVKIWRSVSVLDGAFLVLDIIKSDEEHIYDRWFHGVPDKSNGLAGIHLDMKSRPRFISMKEAKKKMRNHASGVGGYDMVDNMSSATTDSDFGSDWTMPDNPMKLSMRVLNTEKLEAIHGFEWSRQYTKPEKEFLLMSRKARNADFVVLFEPHTGESKLTVFERFDVKCGKGLPVEGALGVMIVLDGKPYEIILNPYGAEIKTCKGITRKVLSVVVKRKNF